MGGRLSRGIDTNVLIASPAALYILSGNLDSLPVQEIGALESLVEKDLRVPGEPVDIFISSMVEHELDKLKIDFKKPPTVRRNATISSHILEMLRQSAALDGNRIHREGAELGNGARVYVVPHDEELFLERNRALFSPNNDDRIVWDYRWLVDRIPALADDFVVVSIDHRVRSTAIDRELRAETFRWDHVPDFRQRYLGRVKLDLGPEQLDAIDTQGFVEVPDTDLLPNQIINAGGHYFIHTRKGKIEPCTHLTWVREALANQHELGDKSLANYSYDDIDEREEVLQAALTSPNLSRKNKRRLENGFKHEQQFEDYKRKITAQSTPKGLLGMEIWPDIDPYHEQQGMVELLANDDLNTIAIDGSGGSGKTLFSMLVGLLKVRDATYEGITYLAPMRSIHEDYGLVPGGKDEKIARHMKPAQNSLEKLFGHNQRLTPHRLQQIRQAIQEERKNGSIVYDVVSDLRGDQLEHRWVIIDEAQLYTREEMRLLQGRMGKGSKFIYLGDPSQLGYAKSKESQGVYLTTTNNGLVHLIDKLKGRPGFGTIVLPKELVKRSAGAGLATLL